MNINKILIFCSAPFIALVFTRILITFCGFVFGFEYNELTIEMRLMLCVVILVFSFIATLACIAETPDGSHCV